MWALHTLHFKENITIPDNICSSICKFVDSFSILDIFDICFFIKTVFIN